MHLLTAERKTKVAALVTFLVALAGLSALTTFATDLTPLPDWLETPGAAAVLYVTTYLTGYVTKHRPSELSPSAVDAFRNGIGSRPGYNRAPEVRSEIV